MIHKLILASASPRRKALLELAGLVFDIVPGDVDESFRGKETPRNHVRRLSREKAIAVAGRYPDAWVLGADTIVLINGEVLGKPRTKDEARAMLRKLSGRTHRVLSGFTILRKSAGTVFTDVVESRVIFKTLSAEEIEWYAETDEPYDKAGAYGIQEKAGIFVSRVSGCLLNVVGLPVPLLLELLKRAGWRAAS